MATTEDELICLQKSKRLTNIYTNKTFKEKTKTTFFLPPFFFRFGALKDAEKFDCFSNTTWL